MVECPYHGNLSPGDLLFTVCAQTVRTGQTQGLYFCRQLQAGAARGRAAPESTDSDQVLVFSLCRRLIGIRMWWSCGGGGKAEGGFASGTTADAGAKRVKLLRN